MSLGSSGEEAVQTNQKHDVVQSPAPPTAPTDPPICDIITCSASSEVGGAKTITGTDPGKRAALASSLRLLKEAAGVFAAPPAGRSAELQDSKRRVAVAGVGAADAPLTLLRCQQLAEELRRVAGRAVGLHRQVSFLPQASPSCLASVFPW